MVPDEIIRKAILKEMPDLYPWCEDEWGDNEIDWVVREFDRTYFDPNSMNRSLVEFAKMMLPTDGGQTYPGIQTFRTQNNVAVAQFANAVMRRIKSYSLVDDDLHDVLDV
jgi:hypothetical protein